MNCNGEQNVAQHPNSVVASPLSSSLGKHKSKSQNQCGRWSFFAFASSTNRQQSAIRGSLHTQQSNKVLQKIRCRQDKNNKDLSVCTMKLISGKFCFFPKEKILRCYQKFLHSYPELAQRTSLTPLLKALAFRFAQILKLQLFPVPIKDNEKITQPQFSYYL